MSPAVVIGAGATIADLERGIADLEAKDRGIFPCACRTPAILAHRSRCGAHARIDDAIAGLRDAIARRRGAPLLWQDQGDQA